MRRLLAIAALAALAAGCTNPCTELGERICRCAPTGTSVDTCKRQVDNIIKSVGPTQAQDSFCSQKLDTCNAPSGIDLCEWIQSPDGKVACGLAYPSPAL